jgi:curved DNA-binding protein
MDHYQTLGVAKTATADEIKKAYRKLASKHHPDKGGDTAKFQEIQTAYDILSDDSKRQEYDNPRPQFQDFGGGFPGGFSFHSGGGAFEDIFEMFNRQHHQQTRRPQVFRTSINVSLFQSYQGGEQIINLQTHTGTQTVKINVPRGVNNGDQVRIDNVIEGASLLVEFRVQPDLRFDRRGHDLVATQTVSVLDLIAGGSFEFTTLSGKTFEVNIKQKTQPYVQLRIPGQGMPIGNSGNFGDQIILIKPFIPDMIDEQVMNSIQQQKLNSGVK